MFQRCLICTDFSDGLHRLVQFVPSLAAGGMKQIVFMHAVPLWQEGVTPRADTEKIEQARERLSSALQNLPSGVEVNVEVPSGRPLDTIPQLAQTYHIDSIVTGMPSRNLLQEKLFGSTTAGLARALATPITIVRPQLISTYTNEELDLRCRHLYRYLLIPYDGSNAAKYLVQKIKHYAQNRPANSLEHCLLCWVVDDARHRELPKDYQLQQAREQLSPIKAELEQLGLQVSVEVRLGNPLTEVLEVAQIFDISAIAISSGTLGRLLEWSIPSFAGELMRRSWHPVLFFPPQK